MNILFDFDGTVVDQRRDRAFRALVKAAATDPSDELAADMYKKDVWLCSHQIYDRTVLFRLYGGHFGDREPEDLCSEFWEEVRKSQRPKPGCHKVFAKLRRRGHRLFCATDTDGPGSNKTDRVMASGVGRYFERVFVGSEGGLPPKGTRGYVERIVQRIGGPKNQCVMIGDKVKGDLIPAHAVGIPSVLVPNSEYRGTWALQAKGLRSLVGIIGRLAKDRPRLVAEFDRYEQAWYERRRAEVDNESRALVLVGCAMATVGEAGHIYRGYTNGDWGIDGEIEFKDNQGRASGKRLYLQLKSGDSYLKKRESDGAEVFQIRKPRWAEYWQQHEYPVMLVIRKSDGRIHWMDVSAYLKHQSDGWKAVKQIVFRGERFNAKSVRRWGDRVLRGGSGPRGAT